jgi:hypothetical protein
MIIVSALLAAGAVAAGCGGSEKHTLTVPASANSKTPLPQVEPVRGTDHEAQALEGAVARFVQWANLYYGKSVLDTGAENTCISEVQDVWHCAVTIKVVKPFKGHKAGAIPGAYTVTRDTKRNQMVYATGTS